MKEIGNSVFRAKAQSTPSSEKLIIGRFFSLRSWRSFDFAQDMLGAIKFVEVVLFNG
jgi:hypothetical protein